MPDIIDSQSPLQSYHHDHAPVQDVNQLHKASLTFGDKVADKIATVVGSWPFIIIQSVLLTIWIVINVYFAINPGALKAFDPYPFILLNLALSFQAAYTGPIVMMSQNRQAEKDRLVAQNDFQCNLTAEVEIRLLMDHLQHQDKILLNMIEMIDRLERKVESLESKPS